MFDCGIHPGLSGMASLPFFDEVDLETVDAILVTHFHLDHCAALPYVVGHTRFRGRIFMTHPTKAITASLLRDFVRVSKGGVAPTSNNQGGGGGGGSAGAGQALYTEAHLDAAMDRTELLDFHATVDLGGGVRVTAHRAGHVLGAAMFMAEVAGLRVLYTGDYSRLADRHLPAADLPSPPPHVLIVEATYGVSRHVPRHEREARFLAKVREILARGGRVLLPVVALGRAQELLLILEEHWAANPRLAASVPVYQASGLARRAMGVYQTYIEMMNDAIKKAFAAGNPFVFKHVRHLRSPAELDDCGPCVVLATPSMLQSGLSRELFEAWCEDSRNGVVIADFAVAGTLAREILSAPETVVSRQGQRLHLRCSVDAISFSAHADFDQTAEFVDALAPPDVVLVHGEATEMLRLKRALEARAAAASASASAASAAAGVGGKSSSLTTPSAPPLRRIFAPKVGQPVHVRHAASHVARVVGGLAGGESSSSKPPRPGQAVRGLLVAPLTAEAAGDAASASSISASAASISAASMAAPPIIVAPGDLPAYTRLRVGRVRQRQAVPLGKGVGFGAVRLALEVLFDGAGGAGELGGVEAVSNANAAAGDAGAVEGEAKEEKREGKEDSPITTSTVTTTATTTLRVGGLVTLSHDPSSLAPPSVLLSWEGGPLADAVADACVAAVLSASHGDGDGPAAVAEAAAAREWEASSPELEEEEEEEEKGGGGDAAGRMRRKRRMKRRRARLAEADARLLAAVLASQFGTAKVVSSASAAAATMMEEEKDEEKVSAAVAAAADDDGEDEKAKAMLALLPPSIDDDDDDDAPPSFIVEVESDGVRVSVDAATGELVVVGGGEGGGEDKKAKEEPEEEAEAAKKQRVGLHPLPPPSSSSASASSRAAALGTRVVAAARRLRAALDPLPLDA